MLETVIIKLIRLGFETAGTGFYFLSRVLCRCLPVYWNLADSTWLDV